MIYQSAFVDRIKLYGSKVIFIFIELPEILHNLIIKAVKNILTYGNYYIGKTQNCLRLLLIV